MCWKILLKAWVDKLTILKLRIIILILLVDRPEIILTTARTTKNETTFALWKHPWNHITTKSLIDFFLEITDESKRKCDL